MLHGFRRALAALALILSPGVAQAASITFAGAGTIERASGTLPQTGVAPIGSAFAFSFTFDPATAATYYSEPGYAVYDLPITNFSASVGGYSFALTDDAGTPPVLVLSRGFSFFGGSSSEPSFGMEIYIPGLRRTASDASGPFVIGAGGGDTLLIDALFKAGASDTSVGLDAIMDPASASLRSFYYSASGPSRQYGQLGGSYAGAFRGAVPEPGTWLLLIAGIGVIGGAMRRRPGQAAFAR